MDLTPDTRNKYLKTLNELCSTLSTTKSMPVDMPDFCQRHGLKASFFDALRDLDGLVFDFSKTGIDESYYTMTPELAKLVPEQVVIQMRAKKAKVKTLKGEVAKPKGEGLSISWFKPSDETTKETDPVQAFGDAFEAASIISADTLFEQVKAVAKDVVTDNVELANAIAKGNPRGEQDSDYAKLKDALEAIDAGYIPDGFDPETLVIPYNIEIEASCLQLKMHVQTTEDADLIDAILFKLNRVSAQPKP